MWSTCELWFSTPTSVKWVCVCLCMCATEEQNENAVTQHYEYGIFFTWLASEKHEQERKVKWKRKNYEKSLSCVYIYENGMFWKWYTYQWRKRASKKANEWKKGSIKRGSYIKDIGIALCFIYHHIWFLFAILLSVLVFCHSNEFFFILFTRKTNRYVCDHLFVRCCQYQFVNYRGKKMQYMHGNNEPSNEYEKKTRSKWILHHARIFNHDYRTQTLIHLDDNKPSKHILLTLTCCNFDVHLYKILLYRFKIDHWFI